MGTFCIILLGEQDFLGFLPYFILETIYSLDTTNPMNVYYWQYIMNEYITYSI